MLASDPVVILAVRLAMAGVFVSGGLHQWRDRAMFAAVVEGYALLPRALVAPVALLLPLAEMATGLLLLWPATGPIGALTGLCLLCGVSLAVVINLLRGRRDIDCGCGGASGDQTLSWALVGRNAVLSGLLVIGTLSSSSRGLGALDVGVAVIAGLAALGLYAACNQLMANAPRLRALRDGLA